MFEAEGWPTRITSGNFHVAPRKNLRLNGNDNTRMPTQISRRFIPRAFFLFSWLGRHQSGALLWTAVCFGGAFVFVEFADEVVEGKTRSIDERLLLSLRNAADHSDPLGPER